MSAVFLTLLLVLATGPASGAQDQDWPRAWTELARLEALAPGDADADAIAAELRRFAQAREGSPSTTVDPARVCLLELRLDRWSGAATDDSQRALARLPLAGLTGPEAWTVAGELSPGPARVRAVQQALHTTPAPTRDQLLLAWNTAVDEARALRLEEGALPIQLVLQERYLAAWSAIDLALTHSRLGNVTALDTLLTGSIAREEAAGRPTAELWSRWGIAVLGFGDESTARDYLGRALARGSSDAALVLGQLDLRAGRLQSARNGLRPSILSDPPAAWALRGWGVSLLPPAHTQPTAGPPQRNP